jgi:hypothetical protein
MLSKLVLCSQAVFILTQIITVPEKRQTLQKIKNINVTLKSITLFNLSHQNKEKRISLKVISNQRPTRAWSKDEESQSDSLLLMLRVMRKKILKKTKRALLVLKISNQTKDKRLLKSQV